MTLNVNDKINGFTVERVRESEELGGSLVEMTHDKTGARLAWLNNGQDNKWFSITFKTLPEDSTGVFHILEHSTLCGSEKYPVREPFVELLKSSMNTFLNAMTAGDCTIYPVSSRNEQDYLNLAGVYMDAVFAPRLVSDPNIFYQEGWHIEQENGQPVFKGVVYNEMKGAMSREDRVMSEALDGMLFTDNAYGFCSGGAPEDIPSLTYEKFVETYRRFYHPSNACVYLDGSVPMEKTLALLNEYFERFDRSEALPQLNMQKPVRGEKSIDYEVAEGETTENKEHMALGKIIGLWSERTKLLAADVLADVLSDGNDAPIKRAVLASGLAKDLDIDVDTFMAQPTVKLTVKGIQNGKADEVRKLIRDTAKTLCEQGIDRAALAASINRLEFRMREPKEPQALIRCEQVLGVWLHGGDPMSGLVMDDIFAAVRQMLKTSAFEALLDELLVNEDGMCVLHALPSLTLGAEKRVKEAERLAVITSAWTDAEKKEQKLLNERLSAWQKTPDSPEQIKTLPTLSLSQVSAEVRRTETVERSTQGVKVLYHPANCHGITYLNLYFALTDFTAQELSRLSLMVDMLGKLPTRKHDVASLQQALKNDVGRMEFSLSSFARKGVSGTCTPCFTVQCSVLDENLERAQELMLEILTQTKTDDLERMKEIVRQKELEAPQYGVAAGATLGLSCVLAHDSASGAVREAMNGYSRICALHELYKNYDEMIGVYTAILERVMRETVCKARLTVSVTAARDTVPTTLLNMLPMGEAIPAEREYRTALPKRMGIRIPAQISYAQQGTTLEALGYRNNASYQVAANIVSLGYLWNEVRVQGGAYGTHMVQNRAGVIATYSYRDPTPVRSLQVNRGIEKFLNDLYESDETLDRYIISSIAGTEPLLSAQTEGILADADWFCGYTAQDAYDSRREMLTMTKERLREFAAIAHDFAEKGAVCVVGYADAMAACEGLELFDI